MVEYSWWCYCCADVWACVLWYALHYILPVESYYKGAYSENSEFSKHRLCYGVCVSNDANQWTFEYQLKWCGWPHSDFNQDCNSFDGRHTHTGAGTEHCPLFWCYRISRIINRHFWNIAPLSKSRWMKQAVWTRPLQRCQPVSTLKLWAAGKLRLENCMIYKLQSVDFH